MPRYVIWEATSDTEGLVRAIYTGDAEGAALQVAASGFELLPVEDGTPLRNYAIEINPATGRASLLDAPSIE
jgi:hypothetical protein